MAWLIPNMPALARGCLEVRIELRVGRTVADLRRGHADVAILAGGSGSAEMPSLHLAALSAIAVSAPVLADGRPPPRTLDELPFHARLAVYQPEGIWERWLRGVGYAGPALDPPTYHEAHFLMIEAAAAGLGVALTPPILAARLLDDGRLVQPMSMTADVGVDYRLVYADAQARRRPDGAAFAAWLVKSLEKFYTRMRQRLSV